MKEGWVRTAVKVFTTDLIHLFTKVLLVSSSANRDKNGRFAVCCVSC